MHDFARFHVADRERHIGSEHDSGRAGLGGKEAQRIGVEHHAVEIQSLEAFARVGVLALCDGEVARQAPSTSGSAAPPCEITSFIPENLSK